MLALALVALSAAGYIASFPPFEWSGLVWVTLVPLLAALDRPEVGAVRGALLAALWALFATGGVIAWVLPTLAGYFEIAWPRAIGLFAFVCIAAAAPYLAACGALLGAARSRLPRWVWLLLIVAAWVVFEFARASLGLCSAWTRLGDALHLSASIRGLASVTGVWGVSALAVLANVAIYEWLRVAIDAHAGRIHAESAPFSTPISVTAAFAAILAIALVSSRAPNEGPDDGLDVVVVQAAIDPELRWKREHATRVLRAHADLTRDALRGRSGAPELIIWPENAIQTQLDDPTHGAALRAFVASIGIPLITGAPRGETTAARRSTYNSAHLLRPDGTHAHYDKMKLLPLSETQLATGTPRRGNLDAETWSPGAEPGLFEIGGQRIGVLICFEAIYPEMARVLTDRGARALLNLSNDGWYRGYGGDRQHLQQVVFRAIETGVPVVRATTTGLTAVIAPDGAVVAALSSGEPGTLRIRIPAPLEHPTLYARSGDLFAWSCVTACGVAIAVMLRRPGRSQK